MSADPVLTVITPTFNRARYLDETIKSVLSQNFAGLEYIIIDDGSSDDTATVVSKYVSSVLGRSSLPQVRYVRHDNIGETRTVNRGLQIARGEFISVVNSDDPLLPGCLDKITDALRRHPAALGAYPDWQFIDAQSGYLQTVSLITYDIETMLTHGFVSLGPGACIRRSVLELVGYRNPLLRYSADLDYWYRIALAGPIVHVPEPLATHRIHPTSMSISDKGTRLADETAYLFQSYCRHPQLGRRTRRWSALAEAHGQFAAMFTCTSEKDAARRLARSFLTHPLACLTRCKDTEIAAVIRHFQELGASKTGLADRLMPQLRIMRSRASAFRLVGRGILRDPAGMLALVEGYGIDKVIAWIRALPRH